MRSVQYGFLDRRYVDWPIALAGVAVVFVGMSGDTAKSFASSVSSFAGIVLGVSSITFTIYHGGAGPRMQMLKRVNAEDVRKNWVSILGGMIFAAVISLIAVAFADMSRTLTVIIAGYGAGFVAIKCVRQMILLTSLMAINDADILGTQTQPMRLDLPEKDESRRVNR